MQRLLLIISVLSLSLNGFSQHTTSHLQGIDVLRYKHHFELNDSTNLLKGRSIITLNIKDAESFFLDFENLSDDGLGMKVKSVTINNWTTEDSYNPSDILHQTPCKFSEENDKLFIRLKKSTIWDSIITIEIKYQGIPRDGLVIGKNKFGNRTFFGDNWPNRAHQWFPCIDHPSDKAFVQFYVTTPAHYEVIANGKWKSYEINEDETLKTVHYQSETELSTKIMVIGVADMETDTVHCHHDFPLTSMVYPENKDAGFHDFAQADSILDFFIKKIGVYPFEKLANVQSTTRFGGMENASCIFYDEHSITGTRSNENLMVHEIAHQWFGNSASEKDWRHLWLSEGFATYLTICYVEEKYGKEKMYEMLQKDKQKVIRFHQMNPRPIIDTTSNYLSLLNPNSYQKGSWFLHMLRNKVGDELFWKGVKKYYETYQFSNANTDDFMKVMEEISDTKLADFFDFWLRQSEYIKLDIKVSQFDENSKMSFQIQQKQKELSDQDIEIQINYIDGTEETFTHKLTDRLDGRGYGTFTKLPEIKSIVVDPNSKLLHEVELTIEKLD